MPMLITTLQSAVSKVATLLQLTANTNVYLAPKVTVPEVGQLHEVQIVENGINVLDADGSVRREDFQLIVALIWRSGKVVADKYWNDLTSQTESIHTAVAKIVDGTTIGAVVYPGLHGSFLTTGSPAVNTLVRPLTFLRESPAYTPNNIKGCLVKEILFVGGYNTDLI